jgi:elongator complex protein 3
LLADCKLRTPRYVRLNRIIRDIPAGHIVAGSTLSNLREIVQRRLREQGQACQCIRCREVRGEPVTGPLALEVESYATTGGEEQFLGYNTESGKLAGFLRLSLPSAAATAAAGLGELEGAALVREVHVYGPVVRLGEAAAGEAQHLGLGGRLLGEAEARARARGYGRLAVIAAAGTREYYRKHGYEADGLYMVKGIG